MNPLDMTLIKSIGIKAGLGRDELSIDFTKIIPADAVMVAICGDNGTGKTTMLDLGMSPHLNPPQVKGNAADQFYDKGERKLKWEHGGEIYQSKIKYHHTRLTKKTEAYLHVRKGEKWVPMALPDHTVSDGKTRTYTACLTHILGPQSVYYLSAFRAQNAPRLADYDDPKGLMRDLLQLDGVKRNADKAHEVRRELSRIYEGMRDQAEHLRDLEVVRDESAVAVKNLGVVIDVNQNRKSEASRAHSKVKAKYDRVVSDSLDKQRLIDERKKVEQQIEHLTQRHNADHAALDVDVKRIMHEILIEKESEIASKIQAASDLEAINLRVEKKRRIIDRAEEIEAACVRLEELCTESTTLDKEGEELRKLDKEKAELENKMIVAKAELNSLLRGGNMTKLAIESCNKRAGFVDVVPCKGQGEYAECPALKDAMSASEHAIELGEQRKELLAQHKNLKEQEQKLMLSRISYSGLDGAIKQHGESLGVINQAIRDTQQVSNLAPELRAAKEDIELAKSQRETIKERLTLLIETHNKRIELLEKNKEEKEEAIKNEQVAYSNALNNYQRTLAELPSIEKDEALAAAEQNLATAERELREATEKLEQSIALQQQRKAEHESASTKIKDGHELSLKAEHISNEIRLWGLLVEGLKGVIDLSIEDAGPGIADYANRLLRDAYGPRFSVNIVTQRQLQNGKTVECFDISVIDADTGIESSIINKSGGETVWLDKALTDAVGLYHQDAAGMNFGTLFSDEAEDGLTAERKRQFYQMDGAALRMGHFERRYFISHNPEAWSMADAVIDLGAYREN